MSGQGDRTTTHRTDDSSVATALVRDLSVLVIKAIAPDETQLAGGTADDRAFFGCPSLSRGVSPW
jgi:hypothetical protein